jgi:hypothetical protein
MKIFLRDTSGEIPVGSAILIKQTTKISGI